MTEPMTITLEGYEVIETTVKKSGNTGRVYAPVGWIDKPIKMILLRPLEETK